LGISAPKLPAPKLPTTGTVVVVAVVAALLILVAPFVNAQPGAGRAPLGDGPWEFTTYEQGGTPIRVSVVTRGLNRPWSMAWLPDGGMLITERSGRLRIVRDGVLDPDPLEGLGGLPIDLLFDVAPHPDFAENGLVYLTYIKRGAHPDGSDAYWATTALIRGRLRGDALADVEEIFEADAWRELSGGDGSRIAFAPDGRLFMSSSHRRDPDGPQDTLSHVGKILRLEDDGSVPADNPFVGQSDFLPEIYSYGHRTVLGLTFHPETGALWETENGPQGGDEVNVILPGKNYGWPLVTYGRDYDGMRASDRPWREDLEAPVVFWVPSIAASGISFYSGARIPAWSGNLFLGAMTVGRIPGTGRLERIVFAENGGEIRRESLLGEFRQRIRDVREGPDGLLYLLTDEQDGALLVIE
jgi:glucose/arabinose dehydrogenase